MSLFAFGAAFLAGAFAAAFGAVKYVQYKAKDKQLRYDFANAYMIQSYGKIYERWDIIEAIEEYYDQSVILEDEEDFEADSDDTDFDDDDDMGEDIFDDEY